MGVETQSASLDPEVFRTSIGWPFVLVWALFFLNLLIVAQFATGGVSVALPWLFAAGVIIVAYLLLSTKYRVEDGILYVRTGPFKRSVAIDSITSITDHGTPKGRLYGLGTDIIGIAYEGGSVNITPKDADGFMAAIGFRFAGSEDTEAPASPPAS